MADFANDILNSIKNDQEFKYNPVLMAVVENLENKRAIYQLEEDYLAAVKQQLAGVNGYVKSKRIEEMLVKIDEHMGSAAGTNVNTKINRMYYEVRLPEALEELRASSIYYEPVVKNYVDAAVNEMQKSSMPYFKYLPGFIGTLGVYESDATVSKWLVEFNKYIADNKKKLMLLETVHYLDGMGNGFYHGVTEKIKPFILSNEYNSTKLKLQLNEFTTIPILNEMILALQSEEAAETKQFHLGTGDGNTKVVNYIGPALKEDNNLVIFVDGRFINLTGSKIDEKNVERVFGDSGGITVQEIKPEYVYESMSDYYQLAKSFEYLNFTAGDRKVSAKLRNIKVDFKVNETGNLDLFLNDEHITEPKNINFHQMFVLENNYVKNCSSLLFENMDKVYNVEFVKLLVNESKNAAAIIMNVNEDYYVYDFVDETKRNIFKADGFMLQNFVMEKFDYDVRALFSIQINDVKDKVNAIEEKKNDISAAIRQLEESYKVLGDTMAKPGIRVEDLELLKGLREKVEREMVTLKNAYILLEDERSAVLGQQPVQQPEEFKLGDNVDYDGQSGRIVAVPNDDKGVDYMVYGKNGRTDKVQKSQMTKSQATNEAKKEEAQDGDKAQKEEKSQQAQDDDKTQKEEKSQQAQDDDKAQKEEKSQKTQDDDKAQKEEKSQKAQGDDKAQKEEKSQQAQEPAEQGIMPQSAQAGQPFNAQAGQSAENTKETAKKISGTLGELRSAIDTVRPEVREKFNTLTTDLDTLIKQSGELERLHDEMGNIKGVSDKIDFAKTEAKFGKVMGELEKITGELAGEFGQSAQQVVVSESLISSAYDKYIAVVSSIADKLTARVGNIVKKLSGDVIDLDADIKVLGARAYAAKAKEDLAGGGNAPNGEIPVAGAQPAAQAVETPQAQNAQEMAQTPHAQNAQEMTQTPPVQNVQAPQPGETPAEHAQEGPQHQAQETPQQQSQEHEKDSSFYTMENLMSLSDEALAKEYAEIFKISEAAAYDGLENNKQEYVNEIMHEYTIITGKK